MPLTALRFLHALACDLGIRELIRILWIIASEAYRIARAIWRERDVPVLETEPFATLAQAR